MAVQGKCMHTHIHTRAYIDGRTVSTDSTDRRTVGHGAVGARSADSPLRLATSQPSASPSQHRRKAARRGPCSEWATAHLESIMTCSCMLRFVGHCTTMYLGNILCAAAQGMCSVRPVVMQRGIGDGFAYISARRAAMPGLLSPRTWRWPTGDRACTVLVLDH